MATAKVNCFIPAPIQQVFELVTDHGNYDQLESVVQSQLLKEGSAQRNGIGAIRELEVSSVRFKEAITVYEVPSRFEYQVLECYLCFGNNGRSIKFPLIHHKGLLTFEEHNGGTKIFWLSQFTVALPFGLLIAKLMRPFVERAFSRILQGCSMAISV